MALGGHSVGAPPAYLHAARHPGRVTRLIRQDPAPPWPRGPRVLARPEGPPPFDWDVMAWSNEFTEPQASSWREELWLIQAPGAPDRGRPGQPCRPGPGKMIFPRTAGPGFKPPSHAGTSVKALILFQWRGRILVGATGESRRYIAARREHRCRAEKGIPE